MELRIPFARLRLICALSLAGLAAWAQAAGAIREIHAFDARPLARLDLRDPANAHKVWDTLHCISALQGLANRAQPRLYIFYCAGFGVDTDQFWLEWLRNEDGWLKGTTVRQLDSLETVLQEFRPDFRGLVVYDPKVAATSNLGSTAAGCEDLLPVRFDPATNSLFHRLVYELKLEVKLWLVQTNGASLFTGSGRVPGLEEPSTGSAKGDACVWAMHRWLREGQAAPGIAAYYIDAYWLAHPQRGPNLHTLCNHDYFISKRAYFFDLSPWGDEPPGDDPGQPVGLDKRLFLQTMRRVHDLSGGGVVKVGGFIPWTHKYTSASTPPGKHDAVLTEWEFGRLISQFNGYMEADAPGLSDMANASFFQHYPLKRAYKQTNPKPGLSNWVARGFVSERGNVAPKLYVGHYVGDYDAPSWLYKAVPKYFPHSSQAPLAWAFNPNLADRAPQAMVYARMHAGSNDWFVAGDSGAGYLNPRSLTVRPDSGLPSGLEVWVGHCEAYYRQWDLSITGFMLDGSGGSSTDAEFAAYRGFSPDGIGTHFEPAPAMKAGISTCREIDLPDEAKAAAAMIATRAKAAAGEPGFLWGRSILKRPDWYTEVSRLLAEEHPGARVAVVDPYTFFGLIKIHVEEKR